MFPFIGTVSACWKIFYLDRRSWDESH